MKKAIITGGSSGMGAAIAVELRHKYEVVVFDLNGSAEDRNFRKVDVTNGDAVRAAFEKEGDVAVVVNAAGVYIPSELIEMHDADIQKQINVNLLGTSLVNKYALRCMSEGGVIINISSALGIVPEPESPVYCATKAGINMLTKALAQRYAPKGIRINAVLPGPVDTPLLRRAFADEQSFAQYEATNLMGRVGQPSEVAKLVTYLVSDDAGFITGVCIPIDGGESSSSLYSPKRKGLEI